MAFTSTDLTNIEAAITELAAGARVVSINIGEKTITYQAAKINELYRLRDLIKSDLGTSGDGGFINKVQFNRPL